MAVRSDQFVHESGSGVVGRIADVARQYPDSVAVSAPDENLTYGALFARALDLGGRLRAAGVAGEDLVALCLPRSADVVVGALGILGAGGAYVSLDPDQPAGRLRFMLGDCGASVLVAYAEVADRVGWQLPVVPPAPAVSTGVASDFTQSRTDAVAYAVYTSGST